MRHIPGRPRTGLIALIAVVSGLSTPLATAADAEGENGSTTTCYPNARGGDFCFPLGDVSFADEVLAQDWGSEAPPEADRTPEGILGPPDYDRSDRGSQTSLGCGGSITLAFTDNLLVDVPGPDIRVFELGGAHEPTLVEVSEDGEVWENAARMAGSRSEADIGWMAEPDDEFRFVRLTDLATVCNRGIPGADIDAVGAMGAALRLTLESSVLFEVDAAELRPAALSELEALVARIGESDPARIVIEGHTDSTGEAEYNAALSLARAESVRAYLEAQGDLERVPIRTVGYGEERPVADNDSEAGRQANRRVEVVVVPEASPSNVARGAGEADDSDRVGFNGRWHSDHGTITFRYAEDGEDIDVRGDYGNDDGRLFMQADGNVLTGYWVEADSRQRCETARDGSHHWGRARMAFDPGFVRFEGSWSYCDAEPDDDWDGAWRGKL